MKRLLLLVHAVASAGWWGAVVAFLALAVAGMEGDHAGACRAMALTGWAAVVPLAALSSLSGLWLSLRTPWGLLRHWWIVFKLVVALPCSILLLLHLQALGDCNRGTPAQMTVDAALALVVLMIPLALSIYKPRGATPLGQRRS